MLLNDINNSVLSAPNSNAIVFGTRTISYLELDNLSNKIATSLISLGVKRGEVVALLGERSVELIVGMVGVMKAGAAYTVVELTGPESECINRLQGCDAGYVLFDQGQKALLNATDLLRVSIQEAFESELPDSFNLPVVHEDDLAYVVYTSGTTGKPKGVVVTHRNVESYTNAVKSQIAMPAGLNYAHLSTFNADLGNTSLFLSLSTAGVLHIIGHELRKDASKLHQYLIQNAISFMKVTPSHWNALFTGLTLADFKKMGLSYLVFGGEVLPRSLVLSLLKNAPNLKLFNHYGPSECTVGTSMLSLNGETLADEYLKATPIGFPLGENVYRVKPIDSDVLSKLGEGELYISGPSVAKGYLNRKEETDKKFVYASEGLESHRSRFYKTGDRVRIDENGLTHFIGRVDRQVKINGYRVELEHIENVIAELDGISGAACITVTKNGKEKLWSFVQINDTGISDQSIIQRLLLQVPEYMVPKELVLLESLPVTSNGKVDLVALKNLIDEKSVVNVVVDENEPELDEETLSIKSVFCRILAVGNAGIEDDFFELGGDSLDAIQLISELQGRGFAISAQKFLKNPSILGIRECVRKDANALQSERERIPYQADTLSSAQHFLLNQKLSDHDHYNQAILFETSNDIDQLKLKTVIEQICDNHPMLTTAYYRAMNGDIRHRQHKWSDESFTYSDIVGDENKVIKELASAVQESINLETGKLFRCHLFKNSHGSDYILLVAHHLAVDLISWRILVGDLVNGYLRGAESKLPKPLNPVDFFEWAAHLDQHYDKVVGCLPTPEGAGEYSSIKYRPKTENTESKAKTIWTSFSPTETEKLCSDLSIKTNSHLSVNLLAALALEISKITAEQIITVEMESHGRVTFDEEIDISRVVGWHTSTFPVDIQCDGDFLGTIGSTQNSIDNITDLGISHGLGLKKQGAISSQPSANFLFNYLGDINFSHEQQLDLSISNKDIGFARGKDNDRLYDIKATAKIVDQSLVLDISYSHPFSDENATKIIEGIHEALLSEIEVKKTSKPTYIEVGTRTGLLSYVPDAVMNRSGSSSKRDYKSILLTGATGYLGIYALKKLLAKTKAHIYCLVRAKNGLTAEKRLRLSYSEYFPHLKLDDFKSRITVLEGDLSQERFGFSDETHRILATELDAIYHFGADTKLFGVESQFIANNIAPVKRLITLAKSCRLKDIHYMSTLAVSGINRNGNQIVFAEDSLDVGQQFQNYYESTKYEAEKLIRKYNLDTGQGFIYRTGNVSGHSRDADFQSNAHENRFIQFLNACIKVGCVPKNLGDEMVLSPVNLVISGVVAISLSRKVGGDVFHVDSDKSVPMEQVFSALSKNGFQFRETEFQNFADLFTNNAEVDSDIALGRLWALRESRNIRYDNRKTLSLLNNLGVHFEELNDRWLVKFFEKLEQRGAFSSFTPLKNVG